MTIQGAAFGRAVALGIAALFADRRTDYPTALRSAKRFQGLYFSVARGDTRRVTAELDAGQNVNRPYSDGETLLMRAVEAGNVRMVDLLIRRGADVRQVDSGGWTAVCFATKPEIARALLREGAAVDGAPGGCPPLVCASVRASFPVVKLLLDEGAAIDRPDRMGTTPLIGAVWGGKSDVVRLLLRKGAGRDFRDRRGLTALDVAKSESKRDIARLLSTSPY